MVSSTRFLAWAMLCLMAATAPVQAEAPAPSSDARLLQRIQEAARELDYSGVFAYQQGSSMQSSRVTHVFDGKSERERLELLDGQPLEFLRKDDEIQCLLPQKHAILVETRTARDRFPGLMIGGADQLMAHYDVSIGEQLERVADRDCQVITLQPKDGDRYGYRLCADSESGLLLRTQTLSPEDDVVEQVAFIALQVGADVDRKQLKPRWKTEGWRVVRTSLNPVDLADLGWTVGEPAGFRRILEVQRSMGGKPDVKQVMLSDGLAAISIFIEPYGNGNKHPQQTGPGARGAVNVVGRRLGDYWITVLGEAPTGTIQQVANSISYAPAAARRH
ncbi:Sigma-E factor regulatory protein RseB precursor [Pigmentiphaga humi]|uniref:Sigma-E factor regulatory protein RseB n=2 Tax=Pigmentiphaga humi TaxID=2478468 RepID=A0A3P4B732_9BURK|nr:Sigma-E factor regulatory protein RseB precursor [Pigmentiphaga humi]